MESYVFGHKIEKPFNSNYKWKNGDELKPNEGVRCCECGMTGYLDDKLKSKEDPCLGQLPGVRSACCGHGKSRGYIKMNNGIEIYFDTNNIERVDNGFIEFNNGAILDLNDR